METKTFEEDRPRVVPFRHPPRPITQTELVEERLLAAIAAKAARQHQRVRSEIRQKLLGGAIVEEGPHFAEIIFCCRRKCEPSSCNPDCPHFYPKVIIR